MILVEYTYAVHPPSGGTFYRKFRKVFLSEEKDALNKFLSILEDIPKVTIRELKEEKI